MPIPSMKWKGLGQAPGLAPWSSGRGAATRCYRHFLFTLSRAGGAGITPGNVTIGDVRHGKWKLERTNTSSWGGHTLTECTKHRIWKYAMEMSGLGKCFLALYPARVKWENWTLNKCLLCKFEGSCASDLLLCKQHQWNLLCWNSAIVGVGPLCQQSHHILNPNINSELEMHAHPGFKLTIQISRQKIIPGGWRNATIIAIV